MQVGQRALAKWGSRYYETVLVEDKGASCVVMHTTIAESESLPSLDRPEFDQGAALVNYAC